MDLSKKKKVEEQEVEVLMDNKEIEETKKNEDPETLRLEPDVLRRRLSGSEVR